MDLGSWLGCWTVQWRGYAQARSVQLAGVGLASLLALHPVYGQRPPTPPYRLAAIRAYRYHNTNGTFSDTIVQRGSGAATAASDSSDGTLVVLELQGQRGSYVPGRQVELMARDDRQLLLNRRLEFAVFGDDGRYFAAFWLHGTRCSTVRLRAQLLGQTDASAMEAQFPFPCSGGVTSAAPTSPPAAAGSVVPPYRITALRAYLFYGAGGTFSENVVQEGHTSLWNEQVSGSFVVVEIRGEDGWRAAARKVRLVGSEAQRVVFDRTVPVPALGRDGRAFEGFWVYVHPCRPLTLRAQLLGQADSSAVEKFVPFDCGE